MWSLLFASALAASGLASTRGGPWVDAHGGLGLGGAPLGAGGGVDASLGCWTGPYDPDYALGRYVGVGLGFRAGPGSTAAVLEARRGVDLLVLGVHGFAAGGWDVTARAPLAELGLGVKARVRPTGRYVGWELRVRGGAVFADVPAAEGGVTLGVAFAAPWRPSPE